MMPSRLFPLPEALSWMEALLVICRLNAIIRGKLQLAPWSEPRP